jgi:methyl-accepting chemotaxis protein
MSGMTPNFYPVLSIILEAAWVGPTMALSLVVIALSFIIIAAVAAIVGREAAQALETLSKEVGELREELQPTMRSVKAMSEEAQGLASQLKVEAGEIIRTSSEIRHDVRRGVDRVRERLEDLDALAEVMQDELEETALDVAARVRSVRTGAGIIGRIRRLLVRGGRR